MLGFLFGLILLLVFVELGGRAMRRWTPNLLEQIAFGGAVGLGLTAYAAGALSAIGELERLRLAPLIPALLLLLASGGLRSRWLAWGEAFRRPRGVMETLLTVAAWLLALLSLILCLLPPDGNEWDALAYHLAFPKLYLQARQNG